uniref:DNA repair protein RecN-like n=1 Tax=Vespula vulgaris TaxID=7454 RepID=UPI00223B2D55|nr:DNA repair protein RecN-like [Vespula vulgaris]
MWTVILTFFISKTSWIFLFVVLYIATFIVILNNDDKERLKKRILDEGKNAEIITFNKNQENMDIKLQTLTERLTEKERMLKQSQYKIKSVEKALNDIENKTSTCRSRYKSLMSDLKLDVHKTEEEVKSLQSQVSNLSLRREELKKEVVKQQEEYEKMLIQFTKDLENKGTGCGTLILKLFWIYYYYFFFFHIVSGCEKSRFSLYKASVGFRLRSM